MKTKKTTRNYTANLDRNADFSKIEKSQLIVSNIIEEYQEIVLSTLAKNLWKRSPCIQNKK